jgi:hypothetical protein
MICNAPVENFNCQLWIYWLDPIKFKSQL